MKQYLAAITAIILCISCSNQQENEMTKNEEVIKQYFEHFNAHDWSKMADMYSATAEFKDPSLGPGLVKQTRAQVIKKYGELSQQFSDVKDKVIAVYPSGDEHIIVEFVSSGTGPDQSKFELPICTIFTIKNGLITQDFTYYDNFGE